jgi:hypothetical protein
MDDLWKIFGGEREGELKEILHQTDKGRDGIVEQKIFESASSYKGNCVITAPRRDSYLLISHSAL